MPRAQIRGTAAYAGFHASRSGSEGRDWTTRGGARTLRLIGVWGTVLLASLAAWGEPVDFAREIRPILSDQCFLCHGPDAESRKASLRLDTQEGLAADLGGYRAVVAGDPSTSEMIRRITAEDPDDLMPPPTSGKSLTPAQVELLTRWINEGAEWGAHWAFLPPGVTTAPALEGSGWPRNAIDAFVLAGLQAKALAPSPEADRATLVRRASLTLTGLPPTPEEIRRFEGDTAPGAYERMIDRLLDSPRYGEHMGRLWLDAARYGDTHGLHIDNTRSIWPYRDWVIRAFNENMPFDQFTIEQLAGDLLPEPTREQRVATGFNRCNVTTSEGGAIPEEFAVRYAVDRTETLATVWLGLTVGCAACHDHKYDPISQREFYELFAFYNSLDENPMDGNALLPPPVVALSTPDQDARLASLDAQIDLVNKVIRAALPVVPYTDPLADSDLARREPREFVWIDDSLPAGAQASTEASAWRFVDAKEGPVQSGQRSVIRSGEGVAQQFFTEAPEGLRVGRGDVLFAHVYLDPADPPREIMLQFNVGGWNYRAFWGEDVIEFGKTGTRERHAVGPLPTPGEWVRLSVPVADLELAPGTRITGWAFTQHGGTVYWDRAGIVSPLPQPGESFESFLVWDDYQQSLPRPDLPEDLRKTYKPRAERSREERQALLEYFIEHVHGGSRVVFGPLHAQRDDLKKQRDSVDQSIVRSLITRELDQPRETHVLIRGEYDKKGEVVSPDTPDVLPPFLASQPRNRLGLARWLVDPANPLTARVTVNRIWQQHFGVGLVRTAENFGAQGDPPAHPELLDWLATAFVAGGWDVKALHRLILTSAAYRQSSYLTPELVSRDPDNQWLGRGPRFRADAEVIRDVVLATSGLLVEERGGPGVRPYQPEGIWEAVSYPTSNTAKYQRQEGEALYRRSLYTFWKRTAPPPALQTFDAPTRESCRVRRERTNTPLQALALLNDIQYVEAARNLAARILREGGSATRERVIFGFELATARAPDAEEQEILEHLYEAQRQRFGRAPASAEELLKVGDSPIDPTLDPPELAAWTMLANTLLNLSETITVN